MTSNHPTIHLPTQPPTHSPNHPSIHPTTEPPNHPPNHPTIHPSTQPPNHPPTHPPPTHSPNHPPIHPTIHPTTTQPPPTLAFTSFPRSFSLGVLRSSSSPISTPFALNISKPSLYDNTRLRGGGGGGGGIWRGWASYLRLWEKIIPPTSSQLLPTPPNSSQLLLPPPNSS